MQLQTSSRCLFIAVLATTTLCATFSRAFAEEAKAAGNQAKSSPIGKSDLPVKKPERRLSGAELYSMHCNRCHPERYPTERTAAQWKTILLHMRVRANLPAEQARTILKYLQDNSGR